MKRLYAKYALLTVLSCLTLQIWAQCNVAAPTTIPKSRCGTGTVTLRANGCAGTYKWYDASSGGTLIGTSSPLVLLSPYPTDFTTPSISATTTYYVDCTVGACTSTRTAVKASVISAIPKANCSVTFPAINTPGYNYGYTGFSFAGINSVADTFSGNYQDQTCSQQAIVNSGGTYPFTINMRQNFLISYIYIDYNNNGVFEDPSEVAFSWNLNTGWGTNTHTSNITIPSNAVTNTNLRMRLVVALDSNGPCELIGDVINSGVAVDFSVLILALSACNPPTAPTVNSPTIASGQTATLTASGCTGTVTWFATATGGSVVYTGNPFTTPALSTNTTYYAECTVNNCASTTRGSGTVTVNAISCPVPTGMQWQNTFPTSFQPYWQGIAGNNYVIRYRISGTINWTETALIPCTQTGLVITTLSGLTNGQTYEWQVKTVCSGTNSSNYSISTFSATYCRAATITAPTGTNLTATTANIQWNSTPINVNLRYRVVGTTMWNTANNLTTSQSWLTGLLPNTNYEAQVQTICSGGILSAFTTSINFTTLNCSNMYSLKTGSWNDITVWSCGRLPTITDNIAISSGHTVTIPSGATGFLNGLNLNGRLINNGRLKYKQL